MASLSIVTVLYGAESVAKPILLDWLHKFSASTKFVFVDNSPKPWARFVFGGLEESRGRTQVIERPDNPGFALGANVGLFNAETDVVLLLNADVRVAKADALVIEAAARMGDCYAAVPLRTNGKVTVGVGLTASGWFVDRPQEWNRPILGCSGGGMLIARSRFVNAGGFREGLFAWGEDAELALRLWARGDRPSELPCVLEHVGGHTVSSAGGRQFKGRLLARNRVVIFRTAFSPTLQFLLCGWFWGSMVVAALRALREGTAFARVRGVMEGLSPRRKWQLIGAESPRFGAGTFLRYQFSRMLPLMGPR